MHYSNKYLSMWVVSWIAGGLQQTLTTEKKAKKGRRPGSSDLRVKKCLILPLTHPRHCNGTSPPQLKIAHNQSTGRHISALLKRINVQCRGQINGWQDSKSIDMDMLFGITSALPSAHTYFLCLCPMGRPVLGLLEKISASGARSVKDNTDEMAEVYNMPSQKPNTTCSNIQPNLPPPWSCLVVFTTIYLLCLPVSM